MKYQRQDGIDPAARSRARRRALQAVYAWQLSGSSMNKVLDQFRDEQDMEIADLAQHLVHAAAR
jgi:N utilization substance protein B